MHNSLGVCCRPSSTCVTSPFVTTRLSFPTRSASSRSGGCVPEKTPTEPAGGLYPPFSSTIRTAISRSESESGPASGKGSPRWRCTLHCPGSDMSLCSMATQNNCTSAAVEVCSVKSKHVFRTPQAQDESQTYISDH